MAIILTGHQRSGTSILALLCQSHPDIMMTNEYGNFFGLGEPVTNYTRFMLGKWWRRRNVPFVLGQSYPAQLRGAYMIQNLIFTARYLNAIRRQGHPVVDAPSVDAALHSLTPEVRVVGDKHPDYAFRLDQFAHMECVRCLFIYRDPRDVASSVVRVARTKWRQWFPPELQEARHVAKRWVQHMEIWQQHAEQVHSVRYEELVTTPQAVLRDLGDWLGVDPEGFQHEMIRSGSMGKYRIGLSEQEVEDVLDVAGPTMHRLNYQF